MATVKFHDGHKTAPVLTSGDVSPAIVAQFLEYVNTYFTKAKVLEVDKVKNILTSFHDIKIDNWIKNNRERFIVDTYTFENFTTELRKRFLHPQWENTIVRNVVNSKMSPTESFVDFANRIMQGNNLLIGTESRLDSNQLRAKLDENMASYLADKIARLCPGDRERITAIEIFEDWYDEIATIDREATDDLKRIADFAAERMTKRQRVDPPPPLRESRIPNTSHHRPRYPLTGGNAVRPYHAAMPGPTQPNTYSRKRTRCPPLTPEEKELLQKHGGCNKCRKFYVSHSTFQCPDDFPDPETYVALTEQMAQQSMAKAAIASTYNSPHPSSSFLPSSSSFIPAPPSSSYSTPHLTSSYMAPPATPFTSSSFIEDTPTQTTAPTTSQPSIAAVLPSTTQTFTLGNGDSDTESSPSIVSPISVPHYIWRANILANAEFPTTLECLLDSGAHLVLIRPETVADLGLRIHKLHTPECATLAINSQPQTFLMYNYVVLGLSSLNNAWTSRPVRALIAANLCTNVLLGLPFLKHNKIVIDHELDTAVVKDTGFDLLHQNAPSPLITPLPLKLSPKQRRDNLQRVKREVLAELKCRCAERLQVLEQNDYFEKIPPFNPIASI